MNKKLLIFILLLPACGSNGQAPSPEPSFTPTSVCSEDQAYKEGCQEVLDYLVNNGFIKPQRKDQTLDLCK